MNTSFFDFKIIAAPEPVNQTLYAGGAGKKGLGIAIRAEENTPQALEQLRGILSALQFHLDEDTVLFVLPEGQSVQISALVRQYKLTCVLFFDLEGADLGLLFSIHTNRPLAHQQVTFLKAPGLHAILKEKQEGGKNLRLGLWQALQQIFPKT